MSVTPASVKKTQESLGKYVKKPPLTDKLLNKPPFRFLHDVISAVIRETGFFHGLYNEVENKSENVKGLSLINQFFNLFDPVAQSAQYNQYLDGPLLLKRGTLGH